MSKPTPSPSKKFNPWDARLILTIILVLASLLFIFSNLEPATIAFFGLKFSMPLWIWFIGLLVIGIAIGWMRPGTGRRDR